MEGRIVENGTGVPKPQMRVLLADDSQFNLKSFENILRRSLGKKYSLEVKCCNQGEKVIEEV